MKITHYTRKKRFLSLRNFLLFISFAGAAGIAAWVYLNIPQTKPEITMNPPQVLWQKNIDTLAKTPASETALPDSNHLLLALATPSHVLYLNNNGEVARTFPLDQDDIAALDQAGRVHILYQKTGTKIKIFLPEANEGKSLTTRAYPLPSPRGKFFLLVSSDSSHLSLWDQNGKVIIPDLSRFAMLSHVSWAGSSDEHLALAFLRGDIVYIQNHKIFSWNIREDFPKDYFLKNIHINSDAGHLFFHHGGESNDWLTLTKIEKSDDKITMKKKCSFKLKTVYPFAIPLITTPGEKPILAAQLPNGLLFLDHKCKVIDTESLVPGLTKSSQDQEALLPWSPRNWEPRGYFDLQVSDRGDMTFLEKRNQEGYYLHLFQNRKGTLAWRQQLFMGRQKYMRAIFQPGGTRVLIQGDTELTFLRIYNDK